MTYDGLFSDRLAGETRITIVDPHIKTPRQIRNLGEFIDTFRADGGSGAIAVHLVTARASGGLDREMRQAQLLVALRGTVAGVGIDLTVAFDESSHDRLITSADWTILLGKGLDIWDSHLPAQEQARPDDRR